MRRLAVTLVALLVSACVGSGSAPSSRPVSRPQPAPVQQRVPATRPLPPAPGFRAPEVMRAPGLEKVIGSSATELERRFGKPRIDLWEGDARKIQFAGQQCVLDIYLYPMEPGGLARATHVEARRPSDGQAVDRAACVRSLGGR